MFLDNLISQIGSYGSNLESFIQLYSFAYVYVSDQKSFLIFNIIFIIIIFLLIFIF
jgi:hypothetical protein